MRPRHDVLVSLVQNKDLRRRKGAQLVVCQIERDDGADDSDEGAVSCARAAHGVRVTSGEKWRRCEPTIAAHSPPRDPPDELGVVNGRADELVGVSVAHLVDALDFW